MHTHTLKRAGQCDGKTGERTAARQESALKRAGQCDGKTGERTAAPRCSRVQPSPAPAWTTGMATGMALGLAWRKERLQRSAVQHMDDWHGERSGSKGAICKGLSAKERIAFEQLLSPCQSLSYMKGAIRKGVLPNEHLQRYQRSYRCLNH